MPRCEITVSHSLCFRQAIQTILLMCLYVLSSPNYVHPVADYDNQDGSFKNITAVDVGAQSLQVRNQKQLAKATLDNWTRLAFPVQKDGHFEWINIANEIGYNHSEEFGLQLLGPERESMIDEIIEKHPKTAIIRIHWKWLSGKGREPITLRTLVDVLDEIGFSELARKMASTCELLKVMDEHYKPAAVWKYTQQLSEKKEPVIGKQWLPKKLHGRNITFVDLELMEKGSDILLDDLLDGLQSGTRVLFIGRPGVGKSTITRHLFQIFIHKERFDLVVKLHLGVSDEIDSLDTLLQAGATGFLDSNEINVISKYLERRLGEGVCFLLDGYDEYVKSHSGADYVASLIEGDSLPKSVVIVTSRPSAAENIEPDRKVEIIGFGERGIQTYLEQLELSQTEYETIHQYFHTHPNVKQLCYLPLHLSMLVYIAVSPTDTGTLSLLDTETKLYTEFLYLTIKQYESVRHRQTVNSLEDCFDKIYTESDLCILLRKISEKAFEGVMNREQTFISSSLDGLPDSINISVEFEALSLFKIEPINDRRGFKLEKYSYSHPTFQEFLAAFHLATLQQREDQLIYIQHFWTQEMYKFFLGLIGSELSQLRYNDKTVSETFVSFAREYLATYQHQDLYIMKCAHEIGQGPQFIMHLQVAGVITNSNSVHLHSYQRHECWYIGYILAQSPLYKLALDSSFRPWELASCLSFIKNYFMLDPESLLSVNVTKLTLGSNPNGYWPVLTSKEDPVSTVEILEFLPTYQNDLTHLELTFSTFEHSASVLQLGKILKSFRKLQFLALSVNVSVIKDGHLESVLRGLNHLKHLELGVINTHDDDTPIPDDLLEFKSQTLDQLKSLTLCISWNKNIADVNMTALIGGLEYLTKLESLSLHILLYGGFRNNGATELFQGIEKVHGMNSLVLHLDLCWELGLGNVTTKELAVALKNLTILKNLSLCIDFNFSGIQGPSGVIELAEGLKELTQLQELSLELKWEL